jgi:phosphoglycerate kinase
MAPVAEAFAALLGRPVAAAPGVAGPAVTAAADALRPGQVLLLENLRFHPGEKSDDPELARALASLADAYVDDAFGTAHRAAASTVGVTKHLPSYAGRLMERELAMLGGALADPARPFVVILGGAKISDKLGVIDALLPKADALLVGGAMANTFLAASGVPMGDSLVEAERLDDARRIAAEAGDKLALPVDLVVADAFDAGARTRVVPADEGVPDGWRALDIGPATVEAFRRRLAGTGGGRPAGTVVWNGPMGAFELAPFAEGTFGVARAVAALDEATTIIGGGDSAAAIEAAGLADQVDWVSTGGGATLEYLEGKPLPAVAALARAAGRMA